MAEDHEEYEVTAFLYVIIFPKSPEEEERYVFCVNWNHQVSISWTTGSFPDILKELQNEGSFWIEQPGDEDEAQSKNGKLPPYDFCFDPKTDIALDGFPLDMGEDFKEEWKREWALKERGKREKQRRTLSKDNLNEFVVPDGASVGEVGEADEAPVPEEDEPQDVAPEVSSRSEQQDGGQKRSRISRVDEEQERVNALQTQEFEAESAKEKLAADILQEIEQRCAVFQGFAFRVDLDNKNAEGYYLVTGFGCCKHCSSRICCWKKDGLLVSSFEDWRSKTRGNNYRTDGFRSHICRAWRGPAPIVNSEPVSQRQQENNLSRMDIQELIEERYGLFLYGLDSRVFKEASYRMRHISAAKRLIPVMFSLPSFLRRLKVKKKMTFSLFFINLDFFFRLES